MQIHSSTSALPRPRGEGRQLVVLCDGTNANLTGGQADTHVVLLAELLAAHTDPQRVVMYDPGVGNPASLPGAGFWDSMFRRWGRVEGLTQGRGVFENILEGYTFLMRHWQPGDEIFLFGFSRGAFTARSLAGMVNRFGLVRPEAESMLTTLSNIYFAQNDASLATSAQAVRLLTHERSRKVRIQFVGVWDTVEAVGMPPFQMRFTAVPTLTGKRFMHVRQALSLDETRRMFQPRLYVQPDGDFATAFGDTGTVQQLWFRGVHADVGGQVPRGEAALGRDAFHWIVSEAVLHRLHLCDAHGPLDTETAVERAVCTLPSRLADSGDNKSADAAASWGGRALLHDAMHGAALWALTGLAPRDTQLQSGAQRHVMKEHPSVARHALSGAPLPTVWQRPQPSQRVARALPWVLACVLGVLAVLMAGQALMAGSARADATDILSRPWARVLANVDFQHWQWLGLFDRPWPDSYAAWFSAWQQQAINAFHLAPRAVFWDVVFIGCYAYVLARLVSWAFARCVGQPRAGDEPSRVLHVLGLALPLLVVADAAENVLSLTTLAMLRGGMDGLPIVTGLVMALASVAKWVGLAGVVALVVRGLRRRKPSTTQQKGAGMAPTVGPSAVSAASLGGPSLAALGSLAHGGVGFAADDGKAAGRHLTLGDAVDMGRHATDPNGFDGPAGVGKKHEDY